MSPHGLALACAPLAARASRFAGGALLVIACAMLGVAAQAQPGADPRSEYEQALSRALEAHAHGDFETARTFMERAHALEPSARTERGLGIVAYAQGQHLAAIRHLDAALSSSFKPLPSDLRAATQDLLAHAWAEVSRCELVLEPPLAEVQVDGAAPDYYAPHVLVLAPGPHTLTVRAPGRPAHALTFEAHAGEQRVLQVVLPDPLPAQVTEKLVYRERKVPRVQPTPGFYDRTMRRTAGSVGGALVIAGAVLWGIGYKRLQDVRALCLDAEPSGCTHSEAEGLYDRRHVDSLSIAGLSIGGAGLATLATMGALEIWQLRERALAVQVAASGLWLHGRF